MKTIKSLPVLFLVLIICLPSCKKYKRMRNTSFEQIETIKNNVLLVRLHSSKNKMKALIEADKADEIAELKKITNERNQETIDAFKNNFDFCEVYFFESSEGEKLRDKKFDEVILLDKNNNEIENPSLLNKGYLVATFGYVYQDVFTYVDDNNETRQVAGSSGLPALVMLDKNYVQLSRPFPYRVMTHLKEEFKAIAVKQLDTQLKNYYYKMERKKLKQKRRG